MSDGDERTFHSGESFTITHSETVELREGDMITDPATGVTYYRQDGEIRTVSAPPGEGGGRRG